MGIYRTAPGRTEPFQLGPVRFGPKIIKCSLITSRYVTQTKRQPLDGL